MIHNGGEEKFGLERRNIPKTKPNGIFTRRQEKLNNVRTEKKKLRSRRIKANEQEREGIKILCKKKKAALRSFAERKVEQEKGEQ